MSTLAILSQGGITGGSVTLRLGGNAFTVPNGVKMICNMPSYYKVTEGDILFLSRGETFHESSSINPTGTTYERIYLNNRSGKRVPLGKTVIGGPYSITFSWSNAINNYTGGAADLTA